MIFVTAGYKSLSPESIINSLWIPECWSSLACIAESRPSVVSTCFSRPVHVLLAKVVTLTLWDLMAAQTVSTGGGVDPYRLTLTSISMLSFPNVDLLVRMALSRPTYNGNKSYVSLMNEWKDGAYTHRISRSGPMKHSTPSSERMSSALGSIGWSGRCRC